MEWRRRVEEEFARLGSQADWSVIEEMAQHAALAFEAARADGMSVADAEASVLALIQSWCCETTGPRRFERPPLLEAAPAGRSPFAGLGLDLRLAFRILRQQPGFALISIVMIALAIGAVTSLFSVVNEVLLNPLPRVNVEGLVRVFEAGPETDPRRPTISNAAYHAWSDNPETIEGLGVWTDWALSLQGPSGLELLRGSAVTASLFRVLRISPVLGVAFTEEHEGTDDVAILSYGFWQERFGGAPDALGKQLTIGGRPRRIIGIMPRGFEFPDREARVWLPQRVPQVVHRESKDSIAMRFTAHNGLARLNPGVTPEQAAGEAAARLAAGLPKFFLDIPKGPFGGYAGRKFVLTPMLDWTVKDVKPAFWILSAAAVLLFAAAIGNVANMQLARAMTREREVAIRSAIGAGSGRLVRQLFVETSVLAVMGGAIGLAITISLLRVLPALMPEDFPRLDDIAVDGRVLGVATALTLAVSLVMGLMPARMARRVKLATALVEDGAAPVGQSLRSPAARSRALIITGQVAIAALLLVGAGLLAQSLFKLINVDRGYQPANLLTARLAHFAHGLPVETRPAFYRQVLERLTATPGVIYVALTNELPESSVPELLGFLAGTNEADPSGHLKGALHVVTTDYFATMGMPILRGRGFTSRDVSTSELAVIVNERFANTYLRGEPLNAILSLDLDSARPCAPNAEKSGCSNPWRVVGIVGDVRHFGDDAAVQPEVFAPRSQMLSVIPATQYLIVRTTGDPAALGEEVRTIIRVASPAGVIEQVMTMETRLMMSLAKPRLYTVLLGGFASFALLIAAIGLFGGLSYGVTQRRREIGVRTALGATPRHIVSMVMKQGTVMTMVGLALGLGAAAATVRYLAGFLFGVPPLDPLTFSLVGAALLVVALVACAIPARRAAKIDAITALRR